MCESVESRRVHARRLQADICICIHLMHSIFNTAQVMTPATRHFNRHDILTHASTCTIFVFRHSRPSTLASAAACPHATRYQSLSSRCCLLSSDWSIVIPASLDPSFETYPHTTRTILLL